MMKRKTLINNKLQSTGTARWLTLQLCGDKKRQVTSNLRRKNLLFHATQLSFNRRKSAPQSTWKRKSIIPFHGTTLSRTVGE